MKQVILAAAMMVAMFAGNTVMAQTRTPKVNQKQIVQHQRIQQGKRNGTLTSNEIARLKMQQAKIRKMKRMAMADGRITPRERMMIKRAQQNANRNIYAKKHNRMYR